MKSFILNIRCVFSNNNKENTGSRREVKQWFRSRYFLFASKWFLCLDVWLTDPRSGLLSWLPRTTEGSTASSMMPTLSSASWCARDNWDPETKSEASWLPANNRRPESELMRFLLNSWCCCWLGDDVCRSGTVNSCKFNSAGVKEMPWTPSPWLGKNSLKSSNWLESNWVTWTLPVSSTRNLTVKLVTVPIWSVTNVGNWSPGWTRALGSLITVIILAPLLSQSLSTSAASAVWCCTCCT